MKNALKMQASSLTNLFASLDIHYSNILNNEVQKQNET